MNASYPGLPDWAYVRERNARLFAAAGISPDGTHAPMTGTHNHHHAAYGTQGGDTFHSHVHSHDGDASHGHHDAPGEQDGSEVDGAALAALMKGLIR